MREMPKAVRDYVDSLPHEGEERVLGQRLVKGMTYPVVKSGDRCLIGVGEDFSSLENFVARTLGWPTEKTEALMAVGCAFDLWAGWDEKGNNGIREAGAQVRQRILDNRLARQAMFAPAVEEAIA